MKPCLIALISLLFGIAAKAEPVPVIFDTDITGDVDDVLALAMLHTLADRGHCEILAVTISKENELAAPFVDAVNTFYGRPDIPIGVGENLPPRESKFLSLVKEKDGGDFRYPHDIGVTRDPEMAVPLIRKTLEAAKDGSVAVIQVGLATNLAQLLETEGAKELITTKVDHLSVMAGAFETINGNNRYLEANVRNEIPTMQILADRWPDSVPVIWSGFKVGISAPYPRESIAQDFDYVDHHIVKEAYLLHSGPDHDRPTWDLTSVLYSVFPDRGYFDYSVPGRVTVEDDGFTRFRAQPGTKWGSQKKSDSPASQSRDRYLIMDEVQTARVVEALRMLVSEPPKK
ncbi:MAG: nucleoside hydrolase [Verrucomicrobiota bacterium]